MNHESPYDQARIEKAGAGTPYHRREGEKGVTIFPFWLIDPAEVTIKIFFPQKELVKTLDLGLKDPGLYVSCGRGGEWDRRNEDQELVLGGKYFFEVNVSSNGSSRTLKYGEFVLVKLNSS
jgi:hypothetical protein